MDSYVEYDPMFRECILRVEKLQIDIFNKLKTTAIEHQNHLVGTKQEKDAYMKGFCRAVDSIIMIISTDTEQQNDEVEKQ